MTLGDRCDNVIALIDAVLDVGSNPSTDDATSKDDAKQEPAGR